MSAIVALLTPDRVVLGSDSRETVIGGGNARTRKLRQTGPWTLAMAGFSGAGNFDARDVIAEAARKAPTMIDVLRAIALAYRMHLRPRLKELRLHPGFGDAFTLGCGLIEVYVAGLDAGRPTLGAFAAIHESREPWQDREQVNAWTGTHRYLGSGIDPLAALIANPPDWVRQADRAAAIRLLTMQAAAHPGHVSPPFDVRMVCA
jgi:hypothetical protein